jgi:hypothetical protein
MANTLSRALRARLFFECARDALLRGSVPLTGSYRGSSFSDDHESGHAAPWKRATGFSAIAEAKATKQSSFSNFWMLR